MKFIWMVVVGIVVACFVVAGQETSIAGPEEIKGAGITPDSALWPLDLIFERASELVSENAKLLHAQERVAEARVMIAVNKTDKAVRVQEGFERVYQRVQNKTRLEEHKALMDNLGQKISAIAKDGPVSEADREAIKALIDAHAGKVRDEEKEIEQEREQEQTQTQNEEQNQNGQEEPSGTPDATPTPQATPTPNPAIGMSCPDGWQGNEYCLRDIEYGQCINNRCEAPSITQSYAKTFYCYSTYCITGGSGIFINKPV